MASTDLALKVLIGLLMVDSAIELALISSMVAWLLDRASGTFEINNGAAAASFPLLGEPLHLLVDQGHTSNGAAGTAFVLVGVGSIIALWLRRRAYRGRAPKLGMAFYYLWLVITVLSALLTLAALIYAFILTYKHAGQSIDVALASTLNNQASSDYVAYPLDQWTPENWFQAILDLDLSHDSDRSDITLYLHIIRGWRWNLIPLFFLGLLVCASAVADALRWRRASHKGMYSQP